MSELTLNELERVAFAMHNYYQLRRTCPDEESDEGKKLSQIENFLRPLSLTGEQLMQMVTFDPLVLGNNDVKRSVYYRELQEEMEKLQSKYDGLDNRYTTLVRKIEKLFGAQFELKDLLDKQGEEARIDSYS